MLLSGEAGIGKSRLTAALWNASPRAAHAHALLLLPAAHRQRVLSDHRPDGTRRWTDARRHAASEAGQARSSAGADFDPQTGSRTLCRDAVAANDGRYPALDLPPPQRRQKTLQALIAQIEALTRSAPVLMIFEDAHWTDPPAWKRSVEQWTGFGPFACC